MKLKIIQKICSNWSLISIKFKKNQLNCLKNLKQNVCREWDICL